MGADLGPRPYGPLTEPVPPPSQWQFSFTPYLWLPWMTGDVVIDRENRHDRIAATQKVDCIRAFLKYIEKQLALLSKTYPEFGGPNTGSSYVVSQIEGTIEHFRKPAGTRRLNPLDL